MSSVHGKHRPFKEVESERPAFDTTQPSYKVTKIVGPDWEVPQGLKEGHPKQASFESSAKKREILPSDIDGPTNYKLLM